MNQLSIHEQNELAMWAQRTRRTRKHWFKPEALAAIEAVESRILASYSDGEIALLQRPDDDWHCIVHPSTKHPGQYQATFCNQTGFLSDSTFESIQEAVKDCFTYGYCVRLEQNEAEVLMLETVEAEAEFQRSMSPSAPNRRSVWFHAPIFVMM